jgi:uncharacterized YigZ family protein
MSEWAVMSNDGTPAAPPGVERYRVPVGEARSESVIKNSTFIGSIGHAEDMGAAEAFIVRVRREFPDASHHAWAYHITGGPQALIGSSDDGEPGGTAGRPMLAVLEGSGLAEVVAVGTRYFGGTKLGPGGLVRAYSGVVREALAALPTEERVLHRLARIRADYALFGHLQYLLPKQGVRIEGEDYTERVSMVLAVPYDRWGAVARLLSELTSGGIDLTRCQVGARYDVVASEPTP